MKNLGKILLLLALPLSLSAQNWYSPSNEYVLPNGQLSGPPNGQNVTPGVYNYSPNQGQSTYHYDNNGYGGQSTYHYDNNAYGGQPTHHYENNAYGDNVYYDNSNNNGVTYYGSEPQFDSGYGYENNCCASNSCCSSGSWFPDIDWGCGWDIEYRNAYFLPSNSLERQIYTGTRIDYEAEISKHLFCNWYAWTNFTYFSKGGGSVEFGDATRLTLYPLSFGVKYVYPIACDWSIYAGLGANYTWMRLKNDSVFIPGENKGCWGGTAKMGVYYELTECLFVDGFADYLYIPMNLSNASNVGGWRFGLGVGLHLF